jgi:hypothetical protein
MFGNLFFLAVGDTLGFLLPLRAFVFSLLGFFALNRNNDVNELVTS